MSKRSWNRRSRRRAQSRVWVVALVALLSTACGGGPAVEPADLVLQGGRISTMDTVTPEAQALAVRGDRVVAIGSDQEIAAYVGDDTEVIDLGGRRAVPGFIEGHGHFMEMGNAQMVLDLTQARTWDDIVAQAAAAAREAEPGEWIVGRGWHQEKWDRLPTGAVEGNPVHTALSEATPDNPVLLTHASGHAAFANARALELAQITNATPDPDGGEIVRGPDGVATGLLRETAQDLVGDALAAHQARRSPEQIQAERRRQVELAGQEALANGVTSFHDAGAPFETIDLYRELADEGALPIRIYAMVRDADSVMARRLPEYRTVGYGNQFLTVRSIKRQIDGALGSHGAWLLEPYDDLPRSTGLVLEPVSAVEQTAELAIENGFQLNTHAIGDRANREVLDIYERVLEGAEARDLRWRIEHAQHLDPADIPRFEELGVIASMQGVHATSDFPWVHPKLGEERTEEGAYVWRELLDAGVVVTNGTDVPVEDIDPIASYYAMVARRAGDGQVYYPEQRLSRQEALETYTTANAFAAFEEDLKGALRPGMLADIAVLSEDILTVPEERIRDARVDMTILGGEVRFRADRAQASAPAPR